MSSAEFSPTLSFGKRTSFFPLLLRLLVPFYILLSSFSPPLLLPSLFHPLLIVLLCSPSFPFSSLLCFLSPARSLVPFFLPALSLSPSLLLSSPSRSHVHPHTPYTWHFFFSSPCRLLPGRRYQEQPRRVSRCSDS